MIGNPESPEKLLVGTTDKIQQYCLHVALGISLPRGQNFSEVLNVSE